MKHINTIGSAALGSVGVVVMSLLGGCAAEQQEPQNRFLVIEQEPNGGYKVVEEMPTDGPNRAIIRERDAQGNITERIMSEEEMRTLAQQEYEKMQSGQSELNAPPSDAGMGLAGTILAVAAGSLLGNMIGNALMNNPNFKRHQESVNRSAYHASKTGAAPAGSNTQKKSYFGDSKQAPSKTSPTTYGA